MRPAAEITRRAGLRSTTMVRGAEAGPANATDLMTSLRGGNPISEAAISACSLSSSDKPWAAAIASSSVGASRRTRRGPYLVFQA